jgi:hypothetical protein
MADNGCQLQCRMTVSPRARQRLAERVVHWADRRAAGGARAAVPRAGTYSHGRHNHVPLEVKSF